MRSTPSPKPRSRGSFFKLKRLWLGVSCVSLYLALASCSTTRVILQTTSAKPKGAAATPAITAIDPETWQTHTKPQLQTLFEQKVYGKFPTNIALTLKSRLETPGFHFNDTAKIAVETLELTNKASASNAEFKLVIVTPKSSANLKGVILMQSFCPVEDVVPEAEFPMPRTEGFSCSGGGFINSVFGYFFGRYIVSPPIDLLIEHGYAFAVMYPSEFIPDSAKSGIQALDIFFSDQDRETRTRAIMAWAKQFALVADYLETEKDFPRSLAYGHSRFGKSALVAGAFDSNIDAVIAHQSGTGGASLSQKKDGESVEQVTRQFPHWFLDVYSENTEYLDQHQLLALIAPRPLLLGNAKRDVWSDPDGAFRAAQGANPAYKLYNSEGLTAKKLTEFTPEDDLSFWIRSGTHGVVKEDWPAFLEFLDTHFKN